MTNNDLHKMSIDELQAELKNIQQELFNLRMQLGSGQQARPHLFQEAKKNIARIKTVLRAKELAGDKHE